MASVDWKKCKNGTGSTTAYARHNFRKNENYSNADIDLDLSEKNWFLGCQTYENAMQKYNERLHEVEANMKRLRSDRINGIMLEYICPDFIQTSQAEYFKDTYKLIEDFFGKDNVIYGAVHYDEIHRYRDNETGEQKFSRPHIHILVVPEKEGRLCAKEIMARAEFNKVNNLINDYCLERYDKSFLTGEQKKGLSVEKLKAEGLKTEALLLEAEKSDLSGKNTEISREIDNKKKELDYYVKSAEHLKKGLKAFSENDFNFTPIKERKDVVVISKKDYNSFVEATRVAAKSANALKSYLDYSKVENYQTFAALEALLEKLKEELARYQGLDNAKKEQERELKREKRENERMARALSEMENKYIDCMCDIVIDMHEERGDKLTPGAANREIVSQCLKHDVGVSDITLLKRIQLHCEDRLLPERREPKTPEKDRDYYDYDYDR